MTHIQQNEELKRRIWQIANDVRGTVDGWDFKQYVLGALFYRFISENFARYIEGGDESFRYADIADDNEDLAAIKDDASKTKGYFIYPSQLFVNVVAKARRDVEEVAALVVDTALQVHKDLGPGLLETVYEAVLAKMLESQGLKVERQKSIPIHYQGISLDEGFRLDLLVDGQLIVELKSVEIIHPVHPKQLLTYLRLMDLPLGLLINFGAPLLKEGLSRVVNKHNNFASSRLRVHQKGGAS